MTEANPFSPPKTQAEAPTRSNRKRSSPLGVAMLVFGTAMMTVGGCLQVYDFGAHVDGPGVGTEFVPHLLWALVAAFLFGLGVFVAGLRRAHWLWLLGAIPVGTVVAAVGGGLIFGAVVPASWERACERGEGRACWGAFAHAKTPAERTAWAAKGCRSHDLRSCERWAELDTSAKAEACGEMERICGPVWTCLPVVCRGEAP